MKGKHIFLIAASLLVMTGCLRDELARMHNEIDSFADTRIKPIEEQILQVQASIKQLEETGGELDVKVKELTATRQTLEQELKRIDDEIAKLIESTIKGKEEIENGLLELRKDVLSRLEIVNAAIDEISQKTESLNSLTDQLDNDVKNGFTDVFEHFKTVADTLADIQVSIDVLKDAITNLDESLSNRIDEMYEGVSDELREAMEAVTEAYTKLIESTKTDIMLIADERISKAVDAAKDKILGWVNEELLGKYYTIAEIDAKIALLEKVDEEHREDVEGLRTKLVEVKAYIESQIERAIKEARIDEKIEEAISKVKSDITELRKQVDFNIYDLSVLFQKVTTLEQQTSKMEGEIAELQKFDGKLKDQIDELERTLSQLEDGLRKAEADNTRIGNDIKGQQETISGINGTIEIINASLDELRNADKRINGRVDSLSTEVEKLRKYISDAETGYKGWAEGLFASVEQYKATKGLIDQIQTSISEIEKNITSLSEDMTKKIGDKETELTTLINTTKERILNTFSEKFKEQLDTLESGLKGWVTPQLDKQYSKLSEQLERLKILEQTYKDQDKIHSQQIIDLRKDLDARESGLVANINDLILKATQTGGVIDGAITSKIEEYMSSWSGKFSSIESSISGLYEYKTSIGEKIATIEQQMENIGAVIEKLKASEKEIQEFIKVLGNYPEEYSSNIMGLIKSLQDEDEKIKDAIDKLDAYIKDPDQYGKEISEWLKASLQTYKDKEYVNGILTDMLGKIKVVRDSIGSDTEGVTSRIGALEDRCEALQQMISDVYTEFEQTVTTNYIIKSDVDNMFTNYYKKSETYSKQQVDDTLARYFSKATFESNIKSLIASTDSKARKKALADSLDALKQQFNAEFEAYMAKALEKGKGGIIDSTINAAINALRNGYEGSLKDLSDSLTDNDVENRIEKLANIVQSVIYIPEYDDNTTAVIYRGRDAGGKDLYYTNLKFRISKSGSAEFNPANYNMVVNSITRVVSGAEAGKNILGTCVISDYSFDPSTSILTIKVDDGIDARFFLGDNNATASVCLTISDDYTSISSKYAPLFVPKILLDKDELNFEYRKTSHGAGEQQLHLTCEGEWTITDCPDWVKLSVSGNAPVAGKYSGDRDIFVNVERNYEGDKTGTVVLQSILFGNTTSFVVKQKARPAQTFKKIWSEPDSILSSDGETIKIYLETSDGENDWTCEKLEQSPSGKKSTAFISFDESTKGQGYITVTADRSSSVERYLTLKFTSYDGASSITYVIVQEAAKFNTDIDEGGQDIEGSTVVILRDDLDGYPFVYLTGEFVLGNTPFSELDWLTRILIEDGMSLFGISEWQNTVMITYDDNGQTKEFPRQKSEALDFTNYPDGLPLTFTITNQQLLDFSTWITEKRPSLKLSINLTFHACASRESSSEEYSYPMLFNITGSTLYGSSIIK